MSTGVHGLSGPTPSTDDRLATAMAELLAAMKAEVAKQTTAAVNAAVGAPERLLSVEEAAAALGLSRALVYRELAAGRLGSMRVHRRRLVPTSAIAAYIEAGMA